MLIILKLVGLTTLLTLSLARFSYSMDQSPKPGFDDKLEELYKSQASHDEKIKLIDDELAKLPPWHSYFISIAKDHLHNPEWSDKLSTDAKQAIQKLIATAEKAHELNDIASLIKELSEYADNFGNKDVFLINTLNMLYRFDYVICGVCTTSSNIAERHADIRVIMHSLEIINLDVEVAKKLRENVNPRDSCPQLNYDLWLRKAMTKLLSDHGVSFTRK